MGNLKKQTKTILLHDGMQDDVDDFLIESPAVERVENGVFDKRGVISKRRGFTELPATDLDGSPAVLGEFRGDLFTTSGGELYRYDEDWEALTGNAALTSVTETFKMRGVPGGHCFSTVKLGDYLVSIFQSPTDGPTPGYAPLTEAVRLSVEVRNEAGNLVYSQSFGAAAFNPQIRANSSSVYIAYAHYTTKWGISFLKITPPSSFQAYASSSHGDMDTDYSLAGVSDCFRDDLAYMRSFESSSPMFQLDTAAGNYVCLAYKDVTGVGVLSVFTRQGVLDWTGSFGSSDTRPLACSVNLTGTHVAVVYHDEALTSSRAAGSVGMRVWTLSSGSVYGTSTLQASRASLVPFSASVHGDSGSTWCVGVSYVALPPIYGDTTTEILCPHTQFFQRDLDASSDSSFSIVGYKLASTVYSTGSDYYTALVFSPPEMGVEQRYRRYTIDGITYTEDNLDAGEEEFSTHRRPGSTILGRLDFSDDVFRPLACLSPGKSVGTPHYKSLYGTILSKLGGNSATLQLTVPEQYEPPSISINMPGTYSTAVESNRRNYGMFGATHYAVNLTYPKVSLRSGQRSLVMSGGIPSYFDGQEVSEVTPLDQPEIMGFRVLRGSGLHYWYHVQYDPVDPEPHLYFKVVVGHVDADGQVHRSSPSFVGALRAIRIAEYCDIVVSVPPSMRSNTNFLEVYQLSEGTYKLVSSKKYTGNESDLSDPVSVQLNLGDQNGVVLDAYTAAGKALYSDGGVLLPLPLGPTVGTVQFGNRLAAVEPSAVRLSVIAQDGVFPDFPSELRIPLPSNGAITNVAVLDDKLVMFEASKIHILYGQGPDNTGRGPGFAVMTLPGDLGSLDGSAVTSIPDGIVFQDSSRLWLLKRDLTLEEFAPGVRDCLVGVTVTAGLYNKDTDTLRFLLSGTATADAFTGNGPPIPTTGNQYTAGTALQVSLTRRAWSRLTNHDATVGTVRNGNYVLLQDDWSLWEEGGYADPSGDNHLKIVTAWLKLNGIQSYGRIWSATFLGRYLSTFAEDDAGDLDAGDVTVKVAYDYEKDDTQTHVFRASEELQPELRDGVTVSADRLQIVVVPKRQKCSAIRFTIEETDTADADGLTYRPGQGFEIPAIELELGMKDTANKSLSAQRKK